jgi:riboflavin biosynthesis pyrimidine reductase
VADTRPAGRPSVIVHATCSLDGRLTVAPGVLLLHGDERFLSLLGEEPYERLMREEQPEALLEGSGSFVGRDAGSAEFPPVDAGAEAEALRADFLPDSIVRRPGHRGWFTIVDSRGRVAWAFREFPGETWAGWHLLVLAARATPLPYLAFLRRESIPYLVAGEERVDLRSAVERLGAELGVRTIVATGGSRLSGALLRAGLVDELDLDLLPALIGGEETPMLFGGPPLGADERPLRMELVRCERRPDGGLRLRYQAG